MSERASAAVWGQTRRFFRMQSRLRSNEPTQIFVCAVTGSVVGALVAGLHSLVDLLHQLGFAVSGDHSLSTGIGVDLLRIMIVPAVGSTRRLMQRMTVDLPAPDGPISAITWPSGTSRSMPLIARSPVR